MSKISSQTANASSLPSACHFCQARLCYALVLGQLALLSAAAGFPSCTSCTSRHLPWLPLSVCLGCACSAIRYVLMSLFHQDSSVYVEWAARFRSLHPQSLFHYTIKYHLGTRMPMLMPAPIHLRPSPMQKTKRKSPRKQGPRGKCHVIQFTTLRSQS